MEQINQSITCVGPWQNREEFISVFDAIYGPDANWQTKQYACDMITIWKLRCQNMTPATVLSTLTILKVQLQDQSADGFNTTTVLRHMYSNAFTRFLNFMSSIMQDKVLKTMYSTAAELGIEPFLVDLRHLCAHGHALPALDIFRRSATYCMDWLKSFYWQPQSISIQNTGLKNVRLARVIAYDNSIRELFAIYDAATEAAHKRIKYVGDIESGSMVANSINALATYSRAIKQTKLNIIVASAINHLTDLTCNSPLVRESATLYFDHWFQCRYFVQTSAKFANRSSAECQQTAEFITLHQNLFRSIAICGFVRPCFDFLLAICENGHETVERRLAASFWAHEIVTGFIIFKEIKRICKTKKERDAKFDFDLTPINTDTMSKDIRDIYRRLGVNCKSVLIFGDSVRQPWTLTFEREYLADRLLNVNGYTSGMLPKCIELSHPPLSAEQRSTLLKLTEIVVPRDTDDGCTAKLTNGYDAAYFTVEDIAKRVPTAVSAHSMDLDRQPDYGQDGAKRYGVWCDVAEHINWETIPFGRPVMS